MKGFIKKNQNRIFEEQENWANTELEALYKEKDDVFRKLDDKERYIKLYIEYSFRKYLSHPHYVKVSNFTTEKRNSSGLFDREKKFSINFDKRTITLNNDTFPFCWCMERLTCEHNLNLKLGKYTQIIEDLCRDNSNHSVEMAEYCWRSDKKN